MNTLETLIEELDQMVTATKIIFAENDFRKGRLSGLRDAISLLKETNSLLDGCGEGLQSLRSGVIEAERAAAIEDLDSLRLMTGWKCYCCKHEDRSDLDVCDECEAKIANNWEWRGTTE